MATVSVSSFFIAFYLQAKLPLHTFYNNNCCCCSCRGFFYPFPLHLLCSWAGLFSSWAAGKEEFSFRVPLGIYSSIYPSIHKALVVSCYLEGWCFFVQPSHPSFEEVGEPWLKRVWVAWADIFHSPSPQTDRQTRHNKLGLDCAPHQSWEREREEGGLTLLACLVAWKGKKSWGSQTDS